MAGFMHVDAVPCSTVQQPIRRGSDTSGSQRPSKLAVPGVICRVALVGISRSGSAL